MLDKASVIIVTHNHKKYLEKCLDSIPSNLEVILVDNISTDGTSKLIEEKYPEVKFIKSEENLGYGKGVNLGVRASSKDYLIILNPDTIVKDNAFIELLKPLVNNENIVTVPKVVLFDGSSINTCGNIEHFTGLTFTRGLGKDIEHFSKYEKLSGLSGACFALKRNLYLKIGGFDENFFLYMEDAEISWNIISKNLEILYIPNSVIYHDYEFNLSAEKIYFVEKGRYIILRKYFNWKYYLLFFPSLLLTEILTFGYAMLKGYGGVKYKLKGLKEGAKISVEHVNCDRKQLFNALDYKIPENETLIPNSIKKISNLVYIINYFLVMNLWNLNAPKMKYSDKLESFNEMDE